MTANVFAVIPVKDELAFTAPLVTQLHSEGVGVLVVDNGSTDGTREWLTDNGVRWVAAPDANLHQMWNMGLDAAPGDADVVAVLNNDITLGDGTMAVCAAAITSLDALVLASPDYSGGTALGGVEWATELGEHTGGVVGWAMLFDATWLTATGFRFPEQLQWWYGDNVALDTVLRSEYKAGIVGGTAVTHHGSATGGDWRQYGVEIASDRRWYAAWSSTHPTV